MGFADFSISDLYTAIISKLNTQLQSVGKLFKNQTTGDFTDQIRYNSTTKRLEYWTGSAWAALDVSGTTIDTVDGFHASQTPGANTIPVLSATGNLVLGSLAAIVPATGLYTNLNVGYGYQTTAFGGNQNGCLAANAYFDGSGWYYIAAGFAAILQQNRDAGPVLYTAASGTAGAAITWNGPYTVWHSNNDGTGSGLDADLLDGQQGSYYKPAAYRGALVYNNTGATAGVQPWLAESYDTDNIHDISVNNSRLTVPSGVTKVKITGSIGLSNGGDAAILKNGTQYVGGSYVSATGTGLTSFSVQLSTAIISVTPGDYFTLTTNSSTPIIDSTGFNRWFAMEIVE